MSETCNVVLATLLLMNAFRPSREQRWAHTFCQDSVCLYFNGTGLRSNSNEWANLVCSKYGLQLLEIPNERTQRIVDAATFSWDDYAMTGYYHRIYLKQFLGGWTWMGTNGALDSKYSILNYPYYAFFIRNSSGIYYTADFEIKGYFSICSYNGSCPTLGFKTVYDTVTSSCIVIVDVSKNWFESRSSCQRMGGDLLTVDPSSTWVSEIPYGSYWVGLTKLKYTWASTGEMSNFYNWKAGQPTEGHECTFIVREYHGKNYWAKGSCIGEYIFICMNGTGNFSDTLYSIPPETPVVTSATRSVIRTTSESDGSFDSKTVGSTSSTKAGVDYKTTESIHFASETPLTSTATQGVIAAIVLGSVLLVVLLSVAVFFLCRQKIRNRKGSAAVYEDEIRTNPGVHSASKNPQDRKYDDVIPPSNYDEIDEASTYVGAHSGDYDSSHYDEITERTVSEVLSILDDGHAPGADSTTVGDIYYQGGKRATVGQFETS